MEGETRLIIRRMFNVGLCGAAYGLGMGLAFTLLAFLLFEIDGETLTVIGMTLAVLFSSVFGIAYIGIQWQMFDDYEGFRGLLVGFLVSFGFGLGSPILCPLAIVFLLRRQEGRLSEMAFLARLRMVGKVIGE